MSAAAVGAAIHPASALAAASTVQVGQREASCAADVQRRTSVAVTAAANANTQAAGVKGARR